MVQGEIGINTDMLRDALLEITLDPLIVLVLITSQLATEGNDELRESRIFKQLRCHSLDQVFVHMRDVVPVDNCGVEPHTATIEKDQECFQLAEGFVDHLRQCLFHGLLVGFGLDFFFLSLIDD